MDMLVVAETFNAYQPAAPSVDNPASFVAYDGGYIEAGDAMGGESPPSPEQVRQSLFDALAQQNFRAGPVSPSIVITYHWGVIRNDRNEIRLPYSIRKNLTARIELVGTQQLADEAENHLLGRRKGDLNSDAPEETILVGPAQTVLEESRQPRYFAIVTAYDYQALLGHQPRMLWRVKLSTEDKSGSMDDVIPALIAGGARYFGKNLENVQNITVPMGAQAASQAVPASEVQSASGSSQLDRAEITSILTQETDRFSGGYNHG
jgi:hypothetical protein